jgi:hypothetical protein
VDASKVNCSPPQPILRHIWAVLLLWSPAQFNIESGWKVDFLLPRSTPKSLLPCFFSAPLSKLGKFVYFIIVWAQQVASFSGRQKYSLLVLVETYLLYGEVCKFAAGTLYGFMMAAELYFINIKCSTVFSYQFHSYHILKVSIRAFEKIWKKRSFKVAHEYWASHFEELHCVHHLNCIWLRAHQNFATLRYCIQ